MLPYGVSWSARNPRDALARSLPTLRLRGNVSSVRIFVFLSLLLHRVPVPVPVLDLVPLATSKFGSE